MTDAARALPRTFSITALAATGVALASLGPAMAADPAHLRGATPAMMSGMSGYAALRGGLTYGDTTRFAVGTLGTLAETSVETEYDMGGFVAAALGVRRGALRGEIELSYARFGVDTHAAEAISGGASTPARIPFTELDSLGDASALSAMVSAYYDLDMGRLSPFVGVGIGLGKLKLDDYGATPLDPSAPGGVVLDDQDIGLAYHATVGASFAVTDKIGLELAYRYQGIESEITTITDIETEVELTSHNVVAGVRIGF